VRILPFMNARFHQRLGERLAEMKAHGTLKTLRTLTSPMDARVSMEGHGEVLVLSSNNYLGLANHPEVIEAGKLALERYGAGTASVRFICGTFAPHRELEEALAAFFGTEAALSYVSCWNANTGILPLLAGEGDALISDELNHASIIDGTRMSKAQRLVYRQLMYYILFRSFSKALKGEMQGWGILKRTGNVKKPVKA